VGNGLKEDTDKALRQGADVGPWGGTVQLGACKGGPALVADLRLPPRRTAGPADRQSCRPVPITKPAEFRRLGSYHIEDYVAQGGPGVQGPGFTKTPVVDGPYSQKHRTLENG